MDHEFRLSFHKFMLYSSTIHTIRIRFISSLIADFGATDLMSNEPFPQSFFLQNTFDGVEQKIECPKPQLDF